MAAATRPPPPPPPIPTFSYTALSNFGWWFGLLQWTRDGAVLTALVSHQCGPGSNPGSRAICGLSLLLVLSFARKGFFPVFFGFPLSSKTKISKFQFDQASGRWRTTSKTLLFHNFAVKTISNTKLNRKPGVSSHKCPPVDHHLFIYKFTKMIYKKWFGK